MVSRDSQRQAVQGRGTELEIRKWWSLLSSTSFVNTWEVEVVSFGSLSVVLVLVSSRWRVGGFVCFPRGKQMNPRHDLLRYPSFDYAVIWVQAVRPALLARFCCLPYSTLWQPNCPSSYSRRQTRRGLNLSLLRSLKVNDSVIDAVKVNEVTDRALFKGLAQDEQQLKNCAKAFGIDTSEAAEFPHQREMAKLIDASRQAKTQSEVKAAADAAARAHGDPVTILSMDWNSLMEKFRVTFGPDLCDNELPAKSHYEDFEESKAECSLEAERVRDQPTKSSSGPSTQCCRTCGSWRSSGNQAGRSPEISPSPLSMTTYAFSISRISTTATKLTDGCCHSRAGRTARHTNMKSGRMLTSCVVSVLSKSQLPRKRCFPTTNTGRNTGSS